MQSIAAACYATVVPYARITLVDVARLAGVHTATASRALNPATRGQVSESTATRVVEAARALNYQPNRMARGLRTNRTFTVGVLIPDITNPLFPPIVRGIEDVLASAGYTALLANSDNDPETERLHVETMLARQVDGLIMATARLHDPLVEEAAASGVPVVLVNRRSEDDRIPSVVPDDGKGIRLAVRHLASIGHTRIAHVAGPLHVSTGLARHRAFLEAMREEALEPYEDLIAFAKWFTVEEGARAFRALLRANKRFTALVTANDLIAIGCYDVLAEQGLRCPEDLSITGYNDIPLLDKLHPPLTTVRLAQYEIGATAANLLLEPAADPNVPARTILVEPTLIVRGSTKSISSRAGPLGSQ
jgi:LacI family transcriptional regulator